MTYVGTFAAPQSGKLIRVDVELHGLLAIATYTITFHDGTEQRERTTLGPDVGGVGLPLMAVIEMLRDLHFAGEANGMGLVHASDVFGYDELELVLSCTGPVHDAMALATSATLQ